MTDFSTITACGECCVQCSKKLSGQCPGCIEADGHVPEWAESGQCRVHACAREHNAAFCGLCELFPCEKLPQLIFWNPEIIAHLTALRDEYRRQTEENRLYAYHVVTDRPMRLGQQILFDETHHSGVYQRVMDKLETVKEIYAHPDEYGEKNLEHHTSVALRELALEDVRKRKYPQYPSRMACLYVSKTMEEAEKWAWYFAKIGRPTYCVVKVKIEGRCFLGDATKCFDGTADRKENERLAEMYWKNDPAASSDSPIEEMLVDGKITVVDIVKEINGNVS